LAPAVAGVAAMGFVMSSTAVIMQVIDENGDTAALEGQRAIAILLLEDMAIVPLLALVALWATLHGAADPDPRPVWQSLAIAIGALAALVAAGRWLLDPLFRVIARAGAREVLTASALLVVLGSALFLQSAGLSM